MSDTGTPTAGDGPEAPALGRELAERQRPLRERRTPLVGPGAHAGPGTLGRRSFDFSLAAGLSLSSRRELGLAVPDLPVDGLPVVPPAELDESLFAPARPRTGNATLDHIIATQMQATAPKRPAPRRGLRSTIGRQSTSVGRDTAPGASARRLRPEIAPMSRDLEIQRLVAGDGVEARPRAPRSGPQFSSTGSPRTPGSWPGREARGRPGRPTPWPEQRGARSPDSGPVPGVAPAVPAPPAAALAGTDLRAPQRLARAGSDVGHTVTPRTDDRGVVEVPTAAQATARLAVGAEHGAGVQRGPSGLQLPRRQRSLPPALGAPRPDRGAGTTTDAAAARLTTLGAMSPTQVESLPVAGPVLTPAAGLSEVPAAAPATPTPRSTPPPVAARTLPGATSAPAPVRPGPSAAVGHAGPRPLDVTAGPDRGAPVPVAGRAASPAPLGGEPALAALLRAAPPGLMLSSPPRRGVTPPRTAQRLDPLLASPDHVGSPPLAPVVGAHPRTRAGSAPSVPGPPRPSAFSPDLAGPSVSDLPVGAPGLSPVAAGAVRSVSRLPGDPGATASQPGGQVPEPGTRGLGTVAAIARPRPLSGASAAGVGVPTPGNEPAPRALRTLPDLGSVAPSPSTPGVRTGSGLPSGAPSPLPHTAVGAASSTLGGAPGSAPSRSGAPPSLPTVAAPPLESLPVVPPATAPTDPGQRFDEVLARHAPPTARPLPRRFEPIARAIVADPSKVRISADPASREALAAVGKVAATSGDTVHLARPLDSSRASVDILAHELTHVAHPSPAVRFYDDDRPSREERRAREVGSVMAAAPVGTPPVSPPPPVSGPPTAGGSAAAQAGGGATRARSNAVSGRPASPPAAPSAPPGVLDPTPDHRSPATGGATDRLPPTAAAAGIDIDRLLDALEARVIRELERRGRRWPRPI